ncbi:DUF892 family protein [Pedobacter duraquae]|uniref:Ferritin-like metal-binding protein YciE n=1 Tax=Pedobacter duraquae TaxID=425511 RepID=A0A4R6IF12_9SPHI|nr:DUF892 family protein [Pedobacter duraquae]TDO20258.1 ferritin-like metal-binding protein YciE [Pedobacter duraquae]
MTTNLSGENSGTNRLHAERLEPFFIEHLAKVYVAKCHLVAKLPQINNQVNDPDLSHGIDETVVNVEKQISRIAFIFSLLDAPLPVKDANGLKGLVEEAFEAIEAQDGDEFLRDLSILFYLQNIENVEAASFQLLQMAAVKFSDKNIGELLKQNFEEAKKNRTLLLLISTKYITNAAKR